MGPVRRLKCQDCKLTKQAINKDPALTSTVNQLKSLKLISTPTEIMSSTQSLYKVTECKNNL